jgi:hypothetical protein
MSQTAVSIQQQKYDAGAAKVDLSSRSRLSPSRTSTVQRSSTQGSGGGSTTTWLWEPTFASSS